MYLSWLITLLGAVVAAALPVVKYERWWHVPAPGGVFVDAMAVLKVLHGGAHATGSALVSSSAIRQHTRIGYDELSLLLEQMVAAGWVGRVQPDRPAQARWRGTDRAGADDWVLLADPDKLRVADVYRLFVFGGARAALAPNAQQVEGSNLSLDAGALARQVEAAVGQGLDQPISAYFAHP
jgi:membrane protein